VAQLLVVKGSTPGKIYPLRGERTIMGRHPQCEVVFDNAAISRQHAQILEGHGSFYIEDLRSRNGTFVNGEEVDGRVPLKHGDQLRICDVVLKFDEFHEDTNAAPFIPPTDDSVDDDPPTVETLDESRIFILPEPSSVEPAFDASSVRRKIASGRGDDQRVVIKPDVKLKAILEITRALGRELSIEQVLPKMLGTLFNIFPHADQAFVLLQEADSDKLKVKATRARAGAEAEAVAVSMTVVRYVMQTGESILSENLSDDSRFNKSTALQRMQVKSMMCVPLVNEEELPIGVIQIVTRDADREFNDDDLDLMESLASQASLAIQNARLHEEALERRALERDLEFATQVQMGFLPKSRPKIKNYAFSDYYEAAERVGGDYFDYVQLPSGKLAVTIGDVAGKGMPAALLMARLYSATRYQLLSHESAGQAVTWLNSEIASSGLGHRFITFLTIVIDPIQDLLTIVNAGHLTPLLRRADGSVEGIGKEESGLPLGILSDTIYKEITIPIRPGEMMVAFTDGVTEAMDAEKKIYGRRRLEALLTEKLDGIDKAIQRIVEDVENFVPEDGGRDDICLVGFGRSAT
jgi:sigma-B regulation protein RsbU (phosphoserine phosphatase)